MNGKGLRVYRRAQRTCARCRNHRLNILVRGHKRYCKYRHCVCEKCLQTAQRQKLMAAQTAQRRADEEDRRRSKAEVDSRSCSVPVKRLYRPYEMSAEDKPRLSDMPHCKETSKHLWESVLLLQGMCNLPASAAPLLHIVLTQVSSNPVTIYRLFLKAKEELEVRGLVGSDVTIPLSLADNKIAPFPTTAAVSASAALYERRHQHFSVHCDSCLTASLYQACYPYPTVNIKSDSDNFVNKNI